MRLSPRLHATLVPLACGALGACGTIADSTRDHGAPGSLRAVVFERYDALAKTNALPRANGADHVDFSPTVGAFVRPGMRLDDVVALFKRNGFDVGAMPPRPVTGDRWQDEHRHELFAGLQVDAFLIGRADVACEIAPSATQGDGATTVGGLRCSLTLATL